MTVLDICYLNRLLSKMIEKNSSEKTSRQSMRGGRIFRIEKSMWSSDIVWEFPVIYQDWRRSIMVVEIRTVIAKVRASVSFIGYSVSFICLRYSQIENETNSIV